MEFSGSAQPSFAGQSGFQVFFTPVAACLHLIIYLSLDTVLTILMCQFDANPDKRPEIDEVVAMLEAIGTQRVDE